MTTNTRLRPHKSRRVTDEQIRVLQSWAPAGEVPFDQLASSMNLSVKYAKRLRHGKIQHKTRSP